MFKKLNKMKIGARLKKSFRQIILIFGILSALVVVIMLYTINNYGTILDNYAYPQGDIAMAMNESAEVRAASRGIVFILFIAVVAGIWLYKIQKRFS